VVLAENDMEVEICGLAMVTRVLVTRRNWLRDRCLWSSGMRVGATAQEKFKILPFRVKIQGLALIGCAWQCSCWRHCFERDDFLQGENLRSMIGRRQRLCTVSLLEASLMAKLIFWCCLGGVSVVVSSYGSL
jgi:hypothetical protein